MGLSALLDGAIYGRYDKTVHFIASAALSAMLLAVWPWWGAAAVALAVGVLKELYDWLGRKTNIEVGDLAADALGIVLVLFVYALVVAR